ncbi:MAG: hypothetical protein IKR34_02865 [Candidatus Gastranaerophilales bacterium]|nr:hypothetical protein [Candidatus Gastranaerophilales bacterium]
MADNAMEYLSAEEKADNTISRIKEFREDIYKSLNITQGQRSAIDVIDNDFYGKIRTKFINNYIAVDKALNLPETPEYKIKNIKATVKQIEISDRKYFDKIKKDYNKKFEHILTKKQLRKYNKLKKDKIKKAKQTRKDKT